MPGNRSQEYLLSVLDGLREGWISELLVHPGYDDDWRQQDLEALRDPRVQQRLAAPDVELVSFAAVAGHGRD
jgi:hypothetical protein